MKMKRILSLLLVMVMSLSMVTVPAFAEASGKAVYDPMQKQVVVTATDLAKDYMVRFYKAGGEVSDLVNEATGASLESGVTFDVSAYADTMTDEVNRDEWTVNIISKASGKAVIKGIPVKLTPLPYPDEIKIRAWQLYDQNEDPNTHIDVEALNDGFTIDVTRPETWGGNGAISFNRTNLPAHMAKVNGVEMYKGWVGIGIKELGADQGVEKTAYKYWYWFDKNTEFNDTIAETEANGTEPDGNTVRFPGETSGDTYDTFFFGVTPENKGKVAFLTVTYTLASQDTVTYTYKLTFDGVTLQTATFVEDGKDEPLAEYMVYGGELVNPDDNYTLGGVTEPTSTTQEGKTFKGWKAAEATEPTTFANLDGEFKAVKYTATWEDEILAAPTAEGLAKGITAANLKDAKDDTSVLEHDTTLYKSYEVTGTQDEQNVNVTINAEGVKAHYAGNNVKGNWVGVAIPQVKNYKEVIDSAATLSENQVRYSYGWGTNPDEPESESAWGTTVTKFGRDGEQPGTKPTHDTIYFDAALAENHHNRAWIKAEYGTSDSTSTTVVFNIKFDGNPLIQTNTVTKVVLGQDTDNGGIKVTEVWAKDCYDDVPRLTNGDANDKPAVELIAPTTDGGVYTLRLTDALENPVFAAVDDGTEVTFELNSSALTEYGTVSPIAKNKNGEIEFTYAEHKYSVSVKVTDEETKNVIDTATVKLTKGTDVYELGYDTQNKVYVYPAGEAESDLSAGNYTLTVTKGGYEKHEEGITISYQANQDDHTAVTLTDVKLKNVEDLGDLVCTYDLDKETFMFAPAISEKYDGYTYGTDYKIYYKASIADVTDDEMQIESATDAGLKEYEPEKGIEILSENKDYPIRTIVAVAIAKDGKMSKPVRFNAPKIGEVELVKTVGGTSYYKVPVKSDSNLIDGLYIATYYTIDGNPEFTFTQVTNNTEVAVKDGCEGLMFILCVGRSDLSAVGTQMPKFFGIWSAKTDGQIPG